MARSSGTGRPRNMDKNDVRSGIQLISESDIAFSFSRSAGYPVDSAAASLVCSAVCLPGRGG
jgi:hypothetical protein